jgi:L-Lysine epsilon oxidase N-terminal/L-lysine epsilon oxidase C-terminal domain
MTQTTKPIVRASIFPTIGIARVGNSREPGEAGYFLGPEVPDELTLPQGQYKDATGALRRQAARFRIYGYDADGQIVGEITSNDASIEWTAHLANKKAAWYNFECALDLPQALIDKVSPSTPRNALIKGADRQQLVIDPGPRSISGTNASGPAFDTGKFFDLPVSLGELRTDAAGRLLVLGGYGVSQSIVSRPPTTFANNDGWHDDTSDGPVDARVTLADGRDIPVEGAWVAVCPPNYAPTLKTVRTLYDLVHDRMVAWGIMQRPDQVSFRLHIQPIFERLTGLQWVNQGFAAYFGSGAPFDASQLLQRLSDPSPANTEFRRSIYAQFRNPNAGASAYGPQLGKHLWPPFYGDALDGLSKPKAGNVDSSLSIPASLASLSDLQLGWLKSWSNGQFISDYDAGYQPPTSLDQLPLEDRPLALTAAALDYCLADAFHPGCELTWPMRNRLLYSTSPFRILRRSTAIPEPDYGPVLTRETVLSPLGPLSGATPGDLSKWMAVPWQTDTASCLAGYDFFATSPDTLPTFWPARVPNQVLSEEDFSKVLNTSLPKEQRLDAFYNRSSWYRLFDGKDDIALMITKFDKLGIIEERSGPEDLPGVPAKVWVESVPEPVIPPADMPPTSALFGQSAAESDQTLPSRYRLRSFGKKRS